MLDFAPRDYQYYGLFALALLLLRIPSVGRYFRVVNTLFHEDGHAVIALLTSGSVEKIDLFADTSGACVYRPKNWFSGFLVALAGYPFSSASAFAMFWLLHNNHLDWFLYGLAGFTGVNLLLWVRNKYGLFWLITFGAMVGTCIYLKNETLNFYFLFFVAALNLIESVYSTLVILYLSADDPYNAGDARSLREQTYVPAIIWGLLFAAQAIYVALWVVEELFSVHILPF